MNEGPDQSAARSDLRGGIGWMAFGSAIMLESLRMERFTAMGATLYTMPGFTPGMIGAALVALGALLALRGWRARRRAGPASSVPVRYPDHALLSHRMLVTLALTLVYAAVLIGRVPFMPATAVFVAVFTGFFSEPETPLSRRAIGAVSAGLLTALLVVLVFERVFLVRLP